MRWGCVGLRLVLVFWASAALAGSAHGGFIHWSPADRVDGTGVPGDHTRRQIGVPQEGAQPRISTDEGPQGDVPSAKFEQRPALPRSELSASFHSAEGASLPVPPKIQTISLDPVAIDSVPEPSAGAVLVLLSTGLLLRRRRIMR